MRTICKVWRVYALMTMLLILAAGSVAAQQFSSDIIVAHKGLNSVGFYSGLGEHLKTIDIGPNPHEIALSTDRRYAYVTNNGVMRWSEDAPGGNTVSIVDLETREKVGEISTGEFRRPHGIDLDPATGLLAVTCERPDRLLLIDPVQRRVLREYPAGGETAHNVILDVGAYHAYVTNITTNSVGVVNLYTGVVTSVPTGEQPQDGAFSADGEELYVACADAVHIIDIKTRQDIGTIGTVGGSRIDITGDGETLVLAGSDGSVVFIDPAERQVTGVVKTPYQLYSMSISKDQRFAFASAEPENEIYVVSIPRRELVRTIIPVENARPDPVWDIPSP